VNLVSKDMAQAMNITAIEFESDSNELAAARLDTSVSSYQPAAYCWLPSVNGM
jgi:flavin reductase (DIM6/NTAB) family NADH-FMN oxidoreductase RutF